MTENELKPCPACGSETEIKTVIWGDWFTTGCNECGMQSGFKDTEELSESAWNTRAATTAETTCPACGTTRDSEGVWNLPASAVSAGRKIEAIREAAGKLGGHPWWAGSACQIREFVSAIEKILEEGND